MGRYPRPVSPNRRTPHPLPGARPREKKQGYLWIYNVTNGAVYYDWATGRGHENDFLDISSIVFYIVRGSLPYAAERRG